MAKVERAGDRKRKTASVPAVFHQLLSPDSDRSYLIKPSLVPDGGTCIHPLREPEFFGRETRKVNANGQTAIPSPLRRQVDHAIEGPGYYLLPSAPSDESASIRIFLFTQRRLAEIIEAMVGEEGDVGPEFARMLYARVERVDPDPQGRIVVPAHLRKAAGVESEAVFLGCGDHIELMSPQAWEEYRGSKEEEFVMVYDAAMSKAFG